MTDKPKTLADEFERLTNEIARGQREQKPGISARAQVDLLMLLAEHEPGILTALRSADSAYARGREDMRREAAAWHDKRAHDTPDAFEQEFHEVSAATILALPPSPEVKAPQPTDDDVERVAKAIYDEKLGDGSWDDLLRGAKVHQITRPTRTEERYLRYARAAITAIHSRATTEQEKRR